MRQDIAIKWAHALRSGNYSQTAGSLCVGYDYKNGEGYKMRHCCLGVLCELAAEEGVVDAIVVENRKLFDGKTDYLPDIVREWAEMNAANGLIDFSISPSLTETKELSLSAMNDNKHNFEEIANIIEMHWDLL